MLLFQTSQLRHMLVTFSKFEFLYIPIIVKHYLVSLVEKLSKRSVHLSKTQVLVIFFIEITIYSGQRGSKLPFCLEKNRIHLRRQLRSTPFRKSCNHSKRHIIQVESYIIEQITQIYRSDRKVVRKATRYVKVRFYFVRLGQFYQKIKFRIRHIKSFALYVRNMQQLCQV